MGRKARGRATAAVKKERYLTRTYNEGDKGYDDFSRLNRALKKQGLYCKDMTGDGNCLFRALADQIDGTPDTHLRHRAAVCDYILRHEGDFAPFMDETYSFDRYVDNMRRSGVYGGNLELVAFARNYQVDIRVYQMGGTVFVISGAPPDTPDDSNRSMPPMYIAYHSYEHYSSVRNKNGPHTGLPETKASIKKHPHSIRNPQVVGSSSLDILQGAHGSSQVELPEPTPFYSVKPLYSIFLQRLKGRGISRY